MELHEVEYHISKSPIIQEALVMVPAEGPFKQRLITLMRLKDVPGSEGKCNKLQLLEDFAGKASAAPLIARAQSHIEREVLRHIVPTLWIPVQRFPRLTSGKTDRGAISR
jgi:acyl-coenzyme A synthetase/AMP-(fatty) acid ligase